MKRLLLVLCLVFAATAPCFADTVNGVLSEERVINLPNDQGKWYISVVGDFKDAQYQTVLKWFKTDASLYKLKRQVHFCEIASNTTIYQKRYSPNVKGLPTVRLQTHQGVVIYEAAGKGLPFTSKGLYGAMANSVHKAQCRPFSPWRRNRYCPCPQPNPQPNPEPILDPEPQPIDDGGTPVFEPTPLESSLPPLWLMLTALAISATAGVVVEWRVTYAVK